jgi:hypothetical protein
MLCCRKTCKISVGATSNKSCKVTENNTIDSPHFLFLTEVHGDAANTVKTYREPVTCITVEHHYTSSWGNKILHRV